VTGASGLRLHHHTGAGDGGTITALSNPMTTLDDLIVGGASGTPARLPKGTDGQALIVDPVTHHLAWGTASAALTDHTHAATGSGATGGGATLQPGTLILPGATSPAQTAEGSAVWDTDDDVLTVGTGATRKTFGYFGNTAPSGLGTASAGSGNEAARLTHIHGMPRLDELGAPTADVSLNTHKVTNVTNPASPQDAATKAYVDGAISGAGGLSDHGIVTYLDYQVAAAPAAPASGYLRHYAKTGGHIAQKDSAGAETLLDATGGGSATIQYPALKAATPTYDFAGAALDGAFSAHSSGGSFATTDCMTQGIDWMGSALEMQFSSQMGALYVTHSDTDFDFNVGGIRATYQTSGSTGMFGVAALNSSGTGVGVVVYNDGNVYIATITTWNYNVQSDTWTGWGAPQLAAGIAVVGDYWLRLKRVSGTWTGYASKSGRAWDKTFTTRSDSIVVDRLVFGMLYNTASLYSGRLTADYMHVAV
jgi:hypothetical protein